jgi:hypothetical protein
MSTLKLTSDDGLVSIDMSSMGAGVSFIGNNPYIIVEPPAPSTASNIAYENFNAVVINLAMFAPRVSISFTEKTGLGTDPFNLSARTTIFSKLLYLFQTDKGKKKLYINSSSNYLYCQISAYRANNISGQKDIVNHSLDLVLVSTVSK